LCPHDSPAARQDSAGNTILTMVLPNPRIRLNTVDQEGRAAVLDMQIDTLVIEPDHCRLGIVWRQALPFSANIAAATAGVLPLAQPNNASGKENIA
jgi:hypothetical protein